MKTPQASIVFINNKPHPLNPKTHRPDVGPNVYVVSERGKPTLGPLKPGDRYKLVGMWEMGSLSDSSKAAMQVERMKWMEARAGKKLGSQPEKDSLLNFCFGN